MLANWTKATTTTTGTGTLTLTAVTGFPLPSKSRATGEYVQYSIVTSDGKYESGIGKIAASDTLERTSVLSTYDGTTYNKLTASALSLASGTHSVYLTKMAEHSYQPLMFPLASGPTNPGVISTHLVGGQANTGAAASQRATAFPFLLETSGLITAMAVYCSVAGAGSTTLLGLYEASSTGWPGRRICKTSATIDTSTTGFKSQAVDTNQRLNPGWYWAALCVTAGTNPSFTGQSTTASPFGVGSNAPIHVVRDDNSATDLADPFPSTTKVYGTSPTNQSVCIHLIMS